MTEIRFYHLQKKSADAVLAELAERALSRGHRIIVRTRDENETNRLNDFLWTFRPDSFLPHGTANDLKPDMQPIFLTAARDNPNNADCIFLMPGCVTDQIDDYKLCCDILDGRDEEQIQQGRSRWKDWKSQNHNMSYWQQNDAGKWEQKQ